MSITQTIERLERLRFNALMAIELVKRGEFKPEPHPNIRDPVVFKLGHFTVIDGDPDTSECSREPEPQELSHANRTRH